MALVVEDGTGVTDSNAYGETTDAQEYYTDMGYTETPTDATLIRGARTLDAMYLQRIKGVRVASDQSMAWPRSDVTDHEGYAVAEDVVPVAWIRASFEMARITPTNQSVSSALYIEKVKAGSVEVDFAGQFVSRQVMDLVEELIVPYLTSQELLRA